MSSLDTWKFLAGLGLFLYGISLMEQVTRKIAGRSFKLFLRNYTKSLGRSILGGTIVTGLIQSSSVVILMLMSFVSAGVIPFRNALGLLIGSNLGTTVDSWFIATVGFSFNLQAYSLPVIAIAGIGMFFTEKRKKVYESLNFIFSIGILLLGFGFMKDGAEQLLMNFNIAAYADANLILILFIGFILTVIIQSSSATVAIALTALHAHALSFPAAACVIIGSEVGTTIKILVSSMNNNVESKMLAWGDFIFNVFTMVISFSFLHWIIVFIQDIIRIKDPLIGLVFFQSFINLLSILVFLPFIKAFSHWLEKLFLKEKKQRGDIFSSDIPPVTDFSAAILKNAALGIFLRSLEFHKKIIGNGSGIDKNGFLPQLKSFARVHGTTDKEYAAIKEAEGNILKYYAGIIKDDLSKEDYKKVNLYLTSIRQSVHAAKSVHDINNDLKIFYASANNFLFQQHSLLQQDWKSFETTLKDLLENRNDSGSMQSPEQLMTSVNRQFHTQVNDIGKPLADHELNEIETSTLLNVYNEILSSKKALVRALASLNAGKDGGAGISLQSEMPG